ncbi:uncharacterized protein SCHCODRAFT_02614106 [Schizophyllum commune H4-8]|nr:uncharacterized protein SCHCODRAFT_02614106 [Schizophyllum commune H4-8]KAI5896127.1 hypothetical protein SCHCODRAFT_02614106 [Schizophyllum commune H4-8]
MSSGHEGESRKRQRSEVDEVDAEIKGDGTHDEKHWYSDGNIVLRVEDSLFRLLNVNSEIFRDMLSVPQPVAQDDLEGCPVVRLPGDSAEGWRSLLDALYDPSLLSTLHTQSLSASLPVLIGITRLATKYRFVAFRRECLVVLGRHFPSFYSSILPMRKRPDLAQASAAISLAREIGAPSLLPFAYLTCASAVTMSRPYVVFDDPSLSFQDKATILQGLHALANLQRRHMFPFAYEIPESIETGCTMRCDTTECFRQVAERPEVLHYLDDYEDVHDEGWWSAREMLCRVCLEDIRETYDGGREDIWSDLPQIFRIGASWADLLREQDTA